MNQTKWIIAFKLAALISITAPAQGAGPNLPDPPKPVKEPLYGSYPDSQVDFPLTIDQLPSTLHKPWNELASGNLPTSVASISGQSEDPKLTLFNLQQAFDLFAWQTFIALNWPADPEIFGKPDPQHKIGQASHADRLWETFISPANVFKADGAKPDAYVPTFSRTNKLHAIGKRTHTLDEVDEAFFDMEKPLPPIVDTNKQYARYEIRLNKVAYDYIVSGAKVKDTHYPLYNREDQNAFLDQGGVITFPDGTIEVKVAWKKLGEGDNPNKFFTQVVDVYENPYADPVVVNKDVTYGMVGMHIMYLVDGIPQWVWPTFEHVDNAPLADLRQGRRKITGEWRVIESDDVKHWAPGPVKSRYNFFNLASNHAEFNSSIGGFSPSSRESMEKHNPRTNANPDYYQPEYERLPSQITKVITVNNEITVSKWTYALNEEVHRRLSAIEPDSVWANYRLTTTQWPSDPGLTASWQQYYARANALIKEWNKKNPGDKRPLLKMSAGTVKAGNPAPVSLGNAVAETYMQINGSCMNCHSGATFGGPNGKRADSNFSFMLQRAKPTRK
ncbi:MAG: hypothetical protein AB8B64_25215 [Granulosicoccus sp.]